MSTQPPPNRRLTTDQTLPALFIDRSVGGVVVPRGLRELGIDVVTLSEHYGVAAGESIEDIEWLHEAGRNGWAILKADGRIRRRPAERAALVESKAQAFLVGGQLPAQEIINRIANNLERMIKVCAEPGPWVYRIHEDRLQRLKITD